MHPQSAYFTELPHPPPDDRLRPVALRVYPAVFRRDFHAPGVALLSFAEPVPSERLRRFLVALKEELSRLYRAERGQPLGYLSLARFDQQVTTKFHLDGSPEEAYLMLGYEPSTVGSRLAVADYTRAAFDRGITPRALLTDHNPMFPGNEARLMPYVTELQGFDPARAQVLLLNNSSLAFRGDRSNSLGVMHQATVLNPTPGATRVVNSTMIGVGVAGPGPDAERAFVETRDVAGAMAGWSPAAGGEAGRA